VSVLTALLHALIVMVLTSFSGMYATTAVPAPVPSTEIVAAGVNTTTLGAAEVETTTAQTTTVTITVLYDNHVAGGQVLGPTLRADHGFACLVEGLDQAVLFDTGADGDILLANMRILGIDPGVVDAVVLSHAHSDHTGGLATVLARNPAVSVYCPASFSQTIVHTAEAAGATVVTVGKPTVVCPGITVTTPLGESISEVGLLVDARSVAATGDGAVLLTGCAHPGLAAMAGAAADLAGGSLYAVLGGFHLTGASEAQVRAIIAELERLGVQRCGPAHCTGDVATALMQRAFGSGFIPMGVGAGVQFCY
jgi:7,8-dihydropterin-6-yl-methyl-4-(beta-D-ribofuranosyl)aminobenzene 5'-phosphate synthase